MPGQDQWDLARLQQVVTEHDLERGRIEYKRELGGGNSTLEAIAALANTFGGAVFVGVDEDKQGLDRLTGVEARERDRLARMCWDKLVPPFSPEIIPVKLDDADKYVLAVVVDADYARRPVMVIQGNKVPVRIEGHNVPADWYRLRDLFAEEMISGRDAVLPPADPYANARLADFPDVDLVIRGRLLLIGPRGYSHSITGIARASALATLGQGDSTLTRTGAVSQLMHQMCPEGWGALDWKLDGPASTQQFTALWQGLQSQPRPRRLIEARLHCELALGAEHGDTLAVQVDVPLTNPRRPDEAGEWQDLTAALDAKTSGKRSDGASSRLRTPPGPFLALGAVRQLMLAVLGTLWGPTGAALSTGILSQPLGPPALLDFIVFALPARARPTSEDSEIPPLNACIDFGIAELIPGNTPRRWTRFGPIRPDHKLLSPAEQEKTVHEWLIRLGIDNGYQNVEEEVARHIEP